MKKIAFFTEGGYQGKVPRNNPNMRTDLAWICSLQADHWNINQTPTQQYDLGIIIIPKKDIQFKGLKSANGSVILKGNRVNQNFFAKGFAIRQIDKAYAGNVYGSFRIIPGFITEETVISMIFALPNTALYLFFKSFKSFINTK